MQTSTNHSVLKTRLGIAAIILSSILAVLLLLTYAQKILIPLVAQQNRLSLGKAVAAQWNEYMKIEGHKMRGKTFSKFTVALTEWIKTSGSRLKWNQARALLGPPNYTYKTENNQEVYCFLISSLSKNDLCCLVIVDGTTKFLTEVGWSGTVNQKMNNWDQYNENEDSGSTMDVNIDEIFLTNPDVQPVDAPADGTDGIKDD